MRTGVTAQFRLAGHVERVGKGIKPPLFGTRITPPQAQHLRAVA